MTSPLSESAVLGGRRGRWTMAEPAGELALTKPVVAATQADRSAPVAAEVPVRGRIETRWLVSLAIVVPFAGFLGLVLLSLTTLSASRSIWHFFLASGFLSLGAGTAFMVGALVGFLFAVPRFKSRGAKSELLGVNTNLEQISDRLTMVILGAGLVSAPAVLKGVMSLAEPLALGATLLGSEPAPNGYSAAGIAVAISWLYFLVAGFIEGFLITRLHLQTIFIWFDGRAMSLLLARSREDDEHARRADLAPDERLEGTQAGHAVAANGEVPGKTGSSVVAEVTPSANPISPTSP